MDRALRTKTGLSLLLVFLFIFNFAETQIEETLKSQDTFSKGYKIAQAFDQIEGSIRFNHQAQPSLQAIGGFSVSYFLLFPLLLLGTAVALAMKKRVGPFRVFTLTLTFNYFLSLPFFLFFPVPERWAYPASSATLMSDLLSTRYIELIRPISGLDNCFPSVHVSFSMIVLLTAYKFRFRFRHSIACLAMTVVLSTLVLGIHWLPDVAMGGIMAFLAFGLASVVDNRYRDKEEPEAVAPAPSLPVPPVRSKGNQVFISYRRERGSQLARVVHSEMERRGIPCFLDVDDLGAEHFDQRLLSEIESIPNFIVILSPGALDRCQAPEDWLRKEIGHAILKKRNIVPLMVEGFEFPEPETLPVELRELVRHNGVSYSHEYFAATFDKLQSFMKFN
ncbi:MAG: TIR domain-containing protein [Nitrospina sp.]|nr:TIR domain-containing protein [Nitrospina sp.]